MQGHDVVVPVCGNVSQTVFRQRIDCGGVEMKHKVAEIPEFGEPEETRITGGQKDFERLVPIVAGLLV